MLKRSGPQAREQNPSKPAVAREFQSPAAALEDERPPAAWFALLFALTALVISAIVFASLADVDEIVVARGQLVTSAPMLVVQPLETVSINTINVKVGDIVRKGQVLASLDPTFADADVVQLRSKLDGYSARQARLEAELSRNDYAIPANPTEAQTLEASLFQERRLQYDSRMRAFDQDIARFTAAQQSARNELAKTEASQKLLSEVVAMREKLAANEFGSRLQLIDAQNQLLAAQRDADQLNGKIAELDHQLDSTSAQRDAFTQEWRAKAADELVSVRRDREAAAEDLDKAIRRQDMVNLTAPRDAIVLEIAQRSAGSVLRQAEALFTLVPLDAPLEVEVRLSPADIGKVRVGEEVRIKLDAFAFQAHGTLKGVIKTISADTFQPQSGGQDAANGGAPYYKARVTLTDTHLIDVPDTARLLPGMTASADIKVGTRRIISYVLYPIIKGLNESIREP